MWNKRIEEIPKIIKTVEEADLDIGVLVNNVGYAAELMCPFLDQKQANQIDIIKVNCISATMLCKDFLPAMRAKGKGAIINISSISR